MGANGCESGLAAFAVLFCVVVSVGFLLGSMGELGGLGRFVENMSDSVRPDTSRGLFFAIFSTEYDGVFLFLV